MARKTIDRTDKDQIQTIVVNTINRQDKQTQPRNNRY